MKNILSFLIILITLVGIESVYAQHYSPGFDFANFNNSPLECLSKAVEQDDTFKIQLLLNDKSININYQEPKFGLSLLSLALHNNKYLSAQMLLEYGEKPNLKSPKDSSTPFLDFCEYIVVANKPDDALRLLIKYGADVNAEKVVPFKETALEFLCESGTLDCVKVLIENGARLDIYPKNGSESILAKAALNSKLDILKYLLIDKKIPIPDYCYIRNEGMIAKKISLRQIIYERRELKDQNQQKLEQEILIFLEGHGG